MPIASGKSVAEQKRRLRHEMSERRRMCAPLARSRAASALATKIAEFAGLERAAVVAGYVPIRGEIDPRPALTTLSAKGAVLVWPRVGTTKPRLGFFRVQNDAEWTHGPFGILEPKPECAAVPIAAIDAFVVPGLAFDAHGYRLGWGGGFYDELIPQIPVRAKVVLVGVAHDFQLVRRCPREPFDAAVDWVITDRQVIRCSQPQQTQKRPSP